MTNLDSTLKGRHYFAYNGPSSQSYGFSSSHVWIWELDNKKGWELKNRRLWTVVLKKTLESLLDCKEIKPMNLKENQSWIFTGRKDWCWSWSSNTLATWHEEPTHWKRPWCWERLKAEGEGDDRGWDGWMAPLTEWTWVWATLRDGEGQRSLACCSPWGRKESDSTARLNNKNLQCMVEDISIRW